jgi:hypothetical protein
MAPGKDKVLDRVQKLLNLSEGGGTEEEAQSALLTAQKLLAKHRLTMADLESVRNKTDEEKIDELVVATGSLNLAGWKSKLAATIAKNFRCKVWSQRDGARLSDGENKKSEEIRSGTKDLIFCGYESDVQVCAHVFIKAVLFCEFQRDWYLMEQKLEKKDFLTQSERMRLGGSFELGFVHGLYRKFEKQVEENEWALVIHIPPAVQDHVKEHHSDIRKTPPSQAKIWNPDAQAAGKAKGEEFGSEHKESQKTRGNTLEGSNPVALLGSGKRYRSFKSIFKKFAEGDISQQDLEEASYELRCTKEHLLIPVEKRTQLIPFEVSWVGSGKSFSLHESDDNGLIPRFQVDPVSASKWDKFAEIILRAYENGRVEFTK